MSVWTYTEWKQIKVLLPTRLISCNFLHFLGKTNAKERIRKKNKSQIMTIHSTTAEMPSSIWILRCNN